MTAVPLAIIKLALISLLGFYLYKKKIINDKTLDALVNLVINFTVPFLFFSRLIEDSQIVLASPLEIFLFTAVIVFLCGYLLGLVISWRKEYRVREEVVGLLSFQNAGYLPMNIAFLLFPAGVRERFLVYVFLYLLGFNIIMWSLGGFLIFRKRGEIFRFKSLFNPPVLSTLIALFFIYSKTSHLIPKVILDPMAMIGDTTFVLSLIILGCWLAKVKLEGIRQRLLLIVEVSLLKLIAMPLLFIAGLIYFKELSLLGVFVALEAAMPCAVSLPIIAHLRGADSEFISQGVFFTHILGIITIPAWLILLEALGFNFL